MTEEYVRAIYIKPDGVYLDAKYSDSNDPFRERKSDRLTAAYTRGGQKGLDTEFVKMLFWGFGEIKGNHPSVTRFRPCIEKAGELYTEARTKIDNKYSELALSDEMLREPDNRLSDEAKVYQKFHRETLQNVFEKIAELAEPMPSEKRRDILQRGPGEKESVLEKIKQDKQNKAEHPPSQNRPKNNKNKSDPEL